MTDQWIIPGHTREIQVIFDEHDITNTECLINTTCSTAMRDESEWHPSWKWLSDLPSDNQCLCSEHTHHSHRKGTLKDRSNLAIHLLEHFFPHGSVYKERRLTVAVVYPS